MKGLKKTTGVLLAGLMCLTVLTLSSSGCSSTELKEGDSGSSQNQVSGKGAVLDIGVMVHLEGWNGEASNQDMFRIH